MGRHAAFPSIWLACIATLCLACGADETASSRPNLLLVTLDTVRADHTSAYGYARDTTPRLRALAGEGVRFESAYAPTPVTGPTHATLFTGLYPLGHGVVKNGLVLDAAFETLAERLTGAGYHTAAVVSSFAVSSHFGYAQGFSRYEDDFDPERSSLAWKDWEGKRVPEGFDRYAEPTTDRALRWLGANSTGDPFFLWVHYFDPHSPYLAPESHRRFAPESQAPAARAAALYDAEVAYADHQMGRLIDALADLAIVEDTLVVVVGDHGEGLLTHDYMFHDFQLYEEAVRVPLVLRWPAGLAAGRVVMAPTSLVDLMPTLLELLGLGAVADAQGVSRAKELATSAAPAPERPVFLQRRPFPPSRIGKFEVTGDGFAIRVGRWKYLEAPDEGVRELFDLATDPLERSNVLAENEAKARELASQLAAWRSEVARALPGRVSPEDRERLRAMGYAE